VLGLLISTGAGAAEFYGKIVAVGDGDTLTVIDLADRRHKVRLSGIDAPERQQAYGDHARAHLAALAHGRHALVVWEKQDRYGRFVGRVLLPECARADCAYSIDLGLEQLRAGLAWHYKQYADEQPPVERWRYATTELQARVRRAGLWQAAAPVPPWSYRKPGQTPIS
jgi:endonuclease YncB( thermonuclease family)